MNFHPLLHFVLVIVEFAIVLGALVLVHETGHFIVAKLCGVTVERFSIGFPPRLFGYTWRGTDYCISATPLGGYVKMAGEYGAETGSVLPGHLNSKPRWQRTLIALAGPFANFLLTLLLFTVVAHFHHEIDAYRSGPAVVDYVPQGSPAAKAGLQPGDALTSFDGRLHPTWETVYEECQLHLGATLPYTFLDHGQLHQAEVTVRNQDGSGEISPDDLQAMGLIPQAQSQPIAVTEVQNGSPADRAGLHAGDLLERIDNYTPHSVPALLAYLRDRNGATSDLLIDRHGQPLHLSVTPEMTAVPGAPTQFRLGFSYLPPPTHVVTLPLGAAIEQAVKETRHDSTLVGRLVEGMFTRQVSVKSLSGPVGIAQQIDLATQLGGWTLLAFVATISLQLGIFNLLPFPPLDGGMIFFLLVESIIRRDVNPEIKERIYMVAFILVAMFFLYVAFNDIMRLHLGH